MEKLLIHAKTEKEEEIRNTVILRIFRTISLEVKREGCHIFFLIPCQEKKDDVIEIIELMNQQFQISLTYTFHKSE